MERKEILTRILVNRKRLVEYCLYPTGPKGLDQIIVEIDSNDTSSEGVFLRNIISLIVQLGATVAGCHDDNKTAVKVYVEELKSYFYFIRKDRSYYISKEITNKSSLKKSIDYVLAC